MLYDDEGEVGIIGNIVEEVLYSLQATGGGANGHYEILLPHQRILVVCFSHPVLIICLLVFVVPDLLIVQYY